MAEDLLQQLREFGFKLMDPPDSKEELIKLLEEAANGLSKIKQPPTQTVLDSLKLFHEAIPRELLKYQDKDIRLQIAVCVSDILRINAPDPPYGDDVLKDIFGLIIETFEGLRDIHCPSFKRRVEILKKTANYKFCLIMLDMECYEDLIYEIFKTFFAVISDEHPKDVLNLMRKIMVDILKDNDDIPAMPQKLLSTVLSPLGRERTDFSLNAQSLAMDVIKECTAKFEPCIKQLISSSLSDGTICLNNSTDSHEVLHYVYQCAPQPLLSIVPDIKAMLLSDEVAVRLKAVQFLGELFALSDIFMSESFQPLFSEFLNKSADKAVEIRISLIEHLSNCLLSNPSRPEAPSIINVLCNLLLDDNTNVRQHAIAALQKVSRHSLEVVTVGTVRKVADCLEDESPSIKKYVMDNLADLYRFYCLKGVACVSELAWIPGKILRCLYDKDFSSDEIELIFCGFLFPPELSVNSRLKLWIEVFSRFGKVEVKALEQILMQKQRLQQELEKYLSFRQTYQEDDGQKKVSVCFRTMSRFFSDPVRAEEGFQNIDQLKDPEIFKMIKCLLDPGTSFSQMWTHRVELLKKLVEKLTLYNFVSTLSTKCSYLLFNKEFIREILLEASVEESAHDYVFSKTCMSLLVIIGSHSPGLLFGFEENLVNLLREDNDVIKEGVAQVLAIAGRTFREQVDIKSSSINLLLKRLCLEGTQKQAKFSVQALAAINKDDGIDSLSELYKMIVEMLKEKTHMPTLLHSLGYIAQFSTPVYETRETEIFEFITHKILEVDNKTEENSANDSERKDMSELCMLKISSIKTLVKSYLPIRGAHLRPGIEKLIEILKNILLFGDISDDVESSTADKACLKLASAKAILKLSTQWDNEIPLDVFYIILRFLEGTDAQSRKTFICKAQQYIAEHRLDEKYVIILLLKIREYHSLEYEEGKRNFIKTIKTCKQNKMEQSLMQSDGKSKFHHLEHILVYLVHALAHHPTFNQCNDVTQFEPIYWQLYLCLSVLLDENEDESNLKMNCSKIKSLFQSIKCSEDAFDRTKSKLSHVISEVGLSIAKRLVSSQAYIQDWSSMSALPPILYKPTEEGEKSLINIEEPFLNAESIVAHFEPLVFGEEKMCSLDDTPLKYKELIGSRIKVWWPLDKVYYEGVVKSYDKGMKKYEILYDDGETEILNLDEEKWKPVREIKMTKMRRKLHHLSSILSNTEKERKKNNLSGRKRKFQRKGPRKCASKKQKNRRNRVKSVKELDSQEDTDVSSDEYNDLDTTGSDSNNDSDDVISDCKLFLYYFTYFGTFFGRQ